MQPINVAAFQSATVSDRPPRWFLLEGLLDDAASRTLAAEYPRTGFTQCERNTGDDKHYRFDVLNAIDHDQRLPELESLTESWRQLVLLLAGDAYRAALSAFVGVDLTAAAASVGFYRYGAGDWVSPHLDKAEKHLTQLFYFNSAWDEAWGGCLKMLERGSSDSACAVLPPLRTHSAIIMRTNQSWHMVERVGPNAPEPRLSAQLELWRR